MGDLTKLQASVTALEAQNVVNTKLITDLLAALLAAQSTPTDQAAIDALQARVDAVTGAEAAEDTTGQAGLPATNTGLASSYPDLATFQAAVAAVTGPDEVLLDGAQVRAGTAAGGVDSYFTHSDQGGVINTTGPTS